jgi:hypothetical protein
MIGRIKKIAAVVLIIWTIAATFFMVMNWWAVRATEKNLSMEAKAHVHTLNLLAASESKVAFLEARLAAAEAERKAFKQTINENAVAIARLKRRAGNVTFHPMDSGDDANGVMLVDAIDCKKCAAAHALPISTKNKYRYCGTPDAFTAPLEVKIFEAYDRAIIAPYEDVARLCNRELAGSVTLHPIRFNIEATAGLGMNGQFALPAIYFETGAKTVFSIGVGIPVHVDPMGATRINPAILWKLERRLWPN